MHAFVLLLMSGQLRVLPKARASDDAMTVGSSQRAVNLVLGVANPIEHRLDATPHSV